MTTPRIIISGGGTGGHIFPAVSIANAIRELRPEAQILFIGAEGRMEMQRVPQAGYEIKGLPIRGFYRPLWKPQNIGVALDYLRSKRMAKRILKEFRPQVAVGVGGYASSAALGAANSLGIPTLIQEQNSYAGLANKQLAAKAAKICVAYEGMERFFPKDKLMLTGNPVRQSLLSSPITREEALNTFGLDPTKKTILLVGGSLGARTINESVLSHLKEIAESDLQFIWQTGKYYHEEMEQRLKEYNAQLSTLNSQLSTLNSQTSNLKPSSQTWPLPIVPPTSWSVVPEPAASRSSALSASPSFSCPALTWPKTTRRRTPSLWQTATLPSTSRTARLRKNSSPWPCRP